MSEAAYWRRVNQLKREDGHDDWYCDHGYHLAEGCPDCDVADHLPTVLPVGGDPRRTEIIEEEV